MKLEDLEIYNLSMDLSDKVWFIAIDWNSYLVRTVGEQWVRAADSVSANISEGYGRGTYNEQKNFYFYARGSLNESKTWLEKAKRRNLIDSETFTQLLKEHDTLGIKLNNFIKSVYALMNKSKFNK